MSDKLSVIEALTAVMSDVQAVAKKDRNTAQGGGYNFRGVDAVVNAVGPALRKHGVVVVPTGTTWESERYQTKNGAQMRGVTLTVSFRFYGPAGDSIEAQASGEASDSGDKAIPKAHSVAYRTLLLQALCIPTDEPDPDSESHERHAESFDELSDRLIELAEELGAKDATIEAIGRHEGDVAWLQRQIKTAEKNVKQRERAAA